MLPQGYLRANAHRLLLREEDKQGRAPAQCIRRTMLSRQASYSR